MAGAERSQLSLLILEAAQSNLNLKVVMARLEQAGAQYGVARSQYFPAVNGIGSAGMVRSSEDTTPVIPESLDRESPLYQIGADFAWELDLWGRVRRIVESSRASYEAAEEAYRDALVVLFSQVALNYVEVRTLQQQIANLENNIEMLKETLDIVTQPEQRGTGAGSERGAGGARPGGGRGLPADLPQVCCLPP